MHTSFRFGWPAHVIRASLSARKFSGAGKRKLQSVSTSSRPHFFMEWQSTMSMIWI
jgi:hypothetical protein